MDEKEVIEKVQELTDLELAILISLVADQHCIIETEEECLNPVKQELELVASGIFGLSNAVVQCSESTTLEEFSNGILVDANVYEEAKGRDRADDIEPVQTTTASNPPSQPHDPISANLESHQDSHSIASIVILQDLSLAAEQVQIQALELLRTKRIFTHTAFYTAPKPFLILILQSTSKPRLINHLTDHIFISHYHPPSDPLPHLSTSPSPQAPLHQTPPPFFPQEAITLLTALSAQTTTTAPLKAYQHNIIIFLRTHRFIDGGVSPRATRHFDQLVTILPPLHHLKHATPSLIALAARKIYPHRIRITRPEDERSMQYGSELAAVVELMDGVTSEGVLEEVLGKVWAPL